MLVMDTGKESLVTKEGEFAKYLLLGTCKYNFQLLS